MTDSLILTQLNREWRRARSSDEWLTAARRWHIVDEPLTNLDQVLAAISHGGLAEQRLQQLISIAATDQVARRVILQRILPGLVTSITKRSRFAHAGHLALDELISAAWLAIAEYNAERRPSAIAAALISDADYRAFRRGWRAYGSREMLTGDVSPHATRHANINPIGLSVICDITLTTDERALVQSLAETGSTAHTAATLHVSARTVRNRRERLRVKLAAAGIAA